jgi:hypothetical protein
LRFRIDLKLPQVLQMLAQSAIAPRGLQAMTMREVPSETPAQRCPPQACWAQVCCRQKELPQVMLATMSNPRM